MNQENPSHLINKNFEFSFIRSFGPLPTNKGTNEREKISTNQIQAETKTERKTKRGEKRRKKEIGYFNWKVIV